MEKKKFQISHFLVFSVIHSIQLGVGVFGFQRIIMESAGNDAWIAVITAALLMNLIIWFMYMLLNRHKKDLVDIHKELFGKWIGGFFSLIWVAYWILIAITVLRTYLEVVQVWVYPTINILIFSLFMLGLTYYCVTGGFRIVAGISFLGIVIPFYIFFTFLFPLEYTNFRNFLPFFNHSISDLAVATKDMILTYIGPSTLLMFYPYIKNPEKSQKWAHLGNFISLALYLYILIISIGFFSEKQVSQHIWATLSMWKIVELPFVERIEYIGITSWILIILPNLCMSVWASKKGIEKIFNLKSKTAIILILLIVLLSTVLIRGREAVQFINTYIGDFAIYIVFVYLPFLAILSFIITKVRRAKGAKS